MRPKKRKTTGSNDLFRARLDQIINLKHELVLLAGKVDWDWIDGEIAPLYSENGRPGIETRFMIGLLLLKHIYGLSDEGVCERWVHDPYFQYFTGEDFFQHAFPSARTSATGAGGSATNWSCCWRRACGWRTRPARYAAKTSSGSRSTPRCSRRPSAFRPMPSCWMRRSRGLNRLARRHGIMPRQSYARVAKAAAMMAGRYAHAKQFKRHQRQLRILRSRLGRIIRDIRRKIEGKRSSAALLNGA